MKNTDVLRRIVNQLEYAPGDYVTLIHDPDEIPFFVSAVSIGADKAVLYSLVCGVVEHTAYAIELRRYVPVENENI